VRGIDADRENSYVNLPVGRAGEALRRRHVARFEQLLPERVRRAGWSWDQVRAERLRALGELLSAAVRRSPWHRERLAGLDVDHFSEADIASLPVMTKADLMDHFGDIVTDTRITRGLCEAHLQQGTGEVAAVAALCCCTSSTTATTQGS